MTNYTMLERCGNYADREQTKSAFQAARVNVNRKPFCLHYSTPQIGVEFCYRIAVKVPGGRSYTATWQE
jgi:hypothetical protein